MFCRKVMRFTVFLACLLFIKSGYAETITAEIRFADVPHSRVIDR